MRLCIRRDDPTQTTHVMKKVDMASMTPQERADAQKEVSLHVIHNYIPILPSDMTSNMRKRNISQSHVFKDAYFSSSSDSARVFIVVRQVMLLSQLVHPCIVSYIDHFVESDVLCIVVRFIPKFDCGAH